MFVPTPFSPFAVNFTLLFTPKMLFSTAIGKLDRAVAVRESGVVTIEIARDVEAFLQEQVRRGVCSDASELVNDVIRSLREQQPGPFEVTPELESWLLEAADSPTTPLTARDFEGIRERAQARLSKLS